MRGFDNMRSGSSIGAETAILQLVHHSECNSTLTLRSDTVSETEGDAELALGILTLDGLISRWAIRRKLLAPRPGNASLEQHCALYAAPTDASHDAEPSVPTVLVVMPVPLCLAPRLPLRRVHSPVFRVGVWQLTACGHSAEWYVAL